MPTKAGPRARASLHSSKATHEPRPMKPDIPINVKGPNGVNKNRIPREPDYDRADDRVLYEEQQVSRIESLMVRGYRDKLKLAKLTMLSPKTVDDYIRRVKARWEIEGGQKHFAEYRGEMIGRLRTIEIQMWDALEAEPIPLNMERKIAALMAIKNVSQSRAEMLGLTKEMIERMMETETEQHLNFNRRTEVFERGARVAAALLDLVEARMASEAREIRTMEHEPAR